MMVAPMTMDDETVWDLGPVKPMRPEKPAVLVETPALALGSEGPPEYEPALRRYTEAYRHYLRALDEYPKERADWEKRHGSGPIQITVASRAETVERDPARYSLKRPATVS
jgi:hypothetical protein